MEEAAEGSRLSLQSGTSTTKPRKIEIVNSTFVPQRVAILGVGLLGGSVALSLRRRLPDIQIVGFSRSEAKRRQAIDLGVVDVAAESVEAASAGCDVVVVATPVDRIADMAKQAVAAAGNNAVVTDVGSTKASIVSSVSDQNFVAAHPIAGSEKTGMENALESLFDGKVIILTPSDTTDSEKLLACDQFWQLTGGRTVQMSAEQHDTYLAAVSHVPHLMSSLVARLTPDEATELVGSGWRDITRVALGDPTLWTAICRENQAAILQQLDRLREDVSNLHVMLSRSDEEALHQWLADAKAQKHNVI